MALHPIDMLKERLGEIEDMQDRSAYKLDPNMPIREHTAIKKDMEALECERLKFVASIRALEILFKNDLHFSHLIKTQNRKWELSVEKLLSQSKVFKK